jgi:predicted anti-sigma-YlaC factor YlaD
MSGGHVHGGPECVALFAKLSEYLDGELGPTACADVEHHMADCGRCREFLESLRRAVAHVAAVEAPELPENLKRDILSAYARARGSS